MGDSLQQVHVWDLALRGHDRYAHLDDLEVPSLVFHGIIQRTFGYETTSAMQKINNL